MSRADIPTVRRPARGRLEVHIPWREGGNRKLIKRVCGRSTRPEWDRERKRWLIARSHFSALIQALAAEFDEVRVVTVHRDCERCDTRCQKALGDECVCSCQGLFHGGTNSYTRDWRLVGTTTLLGTGWSESTWVVRVGKAGAGRRRVA